MKAVSQQINTEQLITTAKALVADDKGLLAMDESNSTCTKRFAAAGIPKPRNIGVPTGK